MEIKETKELIIGLGEAGLLVGKIAKDKKVDFTDIQHVMQMDFSKIMAAAEGADKLKAEIQDLSLEEAKELLLLLVDQVTKVKAA
jgi:hypothetical protein